MTLRQKIEQEIRERGPIPFSRYMELCLYDPDLGYYSRNTEQFGKSGDFYTSSDIHAVFGRLLARQFEEMWRALDRPPRIEIIELGPGRGLFAQDVLDWSERKFSDFFQALRYVLVEQSPALRQRMETTLARHFQSGRARFAELAKPSGVTNGNSTSGSSTTSQTAQQLSTSVPNGKGTTSVVPKNRGLDRASAPEVPLLIFANEFFDALPVEILSDQGSLRIDTREGRFLETWAPPSPEELEFLDRYSIHPEPGERVEVPLIAQCHVDEIFSTFHRGFATVIDYGYTREEQLAGRHRGTLKSIRQHAVSATPYEAPGEQDITADVNFTALAAAAEKHGLQTQKLITQSQFLMGIGEATEFSDAFEECRLPQERAKVALQLKHLVTPAGIGESFHVLVAHKGIESEKVEKLAGLTFGRRGIS